MLTNIYTAFQNVVLLKLDQTCCVLMWWLVIVKYKENNTQFIFLTNKLWNKNNLNFDWSNDCVDK